MNKCVYLKCVCATSVCATSVPPCFDGWIYLQSKLSLLFNFGTPVLAIALVGIARYTL